ncbi:L-threonine 3-dehydrogenase [uncultured delta proteobacterium]|uniref:L-threonine 3-dehydrogenase n=1 Tax=uncultured delta proteobacterium TaxID=34034 RepID=A0A212IW27_9DELT|nr:L-threonine 3-dehydrogenase [uncultured delta proteobacterium]
MQTMKCVVKEEAGPGHLALVTRPVPQPGPREVLTKVLGAAICGTDVHINQWDEWAQKRIRPGVVIGHEFAGEVVEVGPGVKSVKVGDIVSAESHIVCNTCEMCHNGYQHVCYNTELFGVTRDGCFAEYAIVPEENAFVCDPSLPVEISSMMEPLGVAIHGIMEFPVAAKTVAIIGCGPIGAMAVAVAKKVGAESVIALEPNPMRGAMALKMGADHLINPIEQDPVEAVKALTRGGKGVDVVVDYSGNVRAVSASFSYCKPEAKIVAVGIPSKPIEFHMGEFVYRGLTMKGIAGRLMYQNWEQMRGLLAAGLDVSAVVTHTLPLDDFAKGLDLMEKGECGKTILKP